jgi:hypothetical protein
MKYQRGCKEKTYEANVRYYLSEDQVKRLKAIHKLNKSNGAAYASVDDLFNGLMNYRCAEYIEDQIKAEEIRLGLCEG